MRQDISHSYTHSEQYAHAKVRVLIATFLQAGLMSAADPKYTSGFSDGFIAETTASTALSAHVLPVNSV